MSDKQTYTPGPWLLHDQIDEIWTDSSDGMLANIFITDVCGENSLAEDRANARLMASAPELLEALNEMVLVYSALAKAINDDPNLSRSFRNAQDVIAKAKGN